MQADLPQEQAFLEPEMLDLILRHYPAHVHVEELCRSSLEDRVLVEDAVMNLVADGLARRDGDVVVAAGAALRFRE